MWDATTGKETGRFPDQTREVWDMVFLDGGKLMVTSGTIAGGADDAHLKVWDFATKQVVRTLLPPAAFNMARSLAVSPDGKYLALGSAAGPVKVFETASWQEVLSVTELKDVCFRLNFSPDGSTLSVPAATTRRSSSGCRGRSSWRAGWRKPPCSELGGSAPRSQRWEYPPCDGSSRSA